MTVHHPRDGGDPDRAGDGMAFLERRLDTRFRGNDGK
jgi:hypothetical protein